MIEWKNIWNDAQTFLLNNCHIYLRQITYNLLDVNFSSARIIIICFGIPKLCFFSWNSFFVTYLADKDHKVSSYTNVAKFFKEFLRDHVRLKQLIYMNKIRTVHHVIGGEFTVCFVSQLSVACLCVSRSATIATQFRYFYFVLVVYAQVLKCQHSRQILKNPSVHISVVSITVLSEVKTLSIIKSRWRASINST